VKFLPDECWAPGPEKIAFFASETVEPHLTNAESIASLTGFTETQMPLIGETVEAYSVTI